MAKGAQIPLFFLAQHMRVRFFIVADRVKLTGYSNRARGMDLRPVS